MPHPCLPEIHSACVSVSQPHDRPSVPAFFSPARKASVIGMLISVDRMSAAGCAVSMPVRPKTAGRIRISGRKRMPARRADRKVARPLTPVLWNSIPAVME